MPKKDLTGLRFGKLTVLGDSGKRASNGGIIWNCQCDCGNLCEKPGNNLTRKNQTNFSCGKCSRAENLIGQKFNHLTVIKETDQRSNGKMVWACQCDCGNPNLTYVSSSNLKNGSVKSCGCLNRNKKIQNFVDITNKKFNELIAISYLPNNKWKCKCSCGNEIEVSYADLVSNRIKNCGKCPNSYIGQTINNWLIKNQTLDKKYGYYLYQCECIYCGNIEYKTLSAIRGQNGSYCKNCHEDNLIGQKFEKLLVIEKDKSNKYKWICKCDCGNTVSVTGHNLKSKNTCSCGCLKQSSGEYIIEELLKNNNIKYETQKTFENCRFPNTKALARFDFYLPDYNCLIEYDGEQHFKENTIFSDSLKDIQKRDNYKTNWAKHNHIKLLRIPYYEKKNLNIDLILNFIKS